MREYDKFILKRANKTDIHVRMVQNDKRNSFFLYKNVLLVHGRDEAMASGAQILETKKQPETVLHKYFYFHPENVCSRCHGFIPTCTCTFNVPGYDVKNVECVLQLYYYYMFILLYKYTMNV